LNKQELINLPFPESLIKTRKGNFGRDIVYVEACEYIKRLNDVYSHQWDWIILREFRDGDHIVVLGELKAGPYNAKQAFGGAQIKRNKRTGEMIDLADDYKVAATDAFKKACSLVGIGLHLWSEPGDTPEDIQNEPEIKTLNPFVPETPKQFQERNRIDRVYDAFKQYGIDRAQLEKALNKPDFEWNEDDLAFLRQEIIRAAKCKDEFILANKEEA